jgi:hypothetical protein
MAAGMPSETRDFGAIAATSSTSSALTTSAHMLFTASSPRLKLSFKLSNPIISGQGGLIVIRLKSLYSRIALSLLPLLPSLFCPLLINFPVPVEVAFTLEMIQQRIQLFGSVERARGVAVPDCGFVEEILLVV